MTWKGSSVRPLPERQTKTSGFFREPCSNPSGLEIGILFLILIKSNYNNLKVSGVDNPMKELIQSSFYPVYEYGDQLLCSTFLLFNCALFETILKFVYCA